MGQYWIPVNLDKREFICPHKLAAGLKLCEQLANHPGTGAALILLCAAMPERRGGGDLDLDDLDEIEDGQESDYSATARQVIGRWAGDRIALVGDYAEPGDLAPEHDADLIFSLCKDDEDREGTADHWEKCEWTNDSVMRAEYAEKARRLRAAKPYRDISEPVCRVIAHELEGDYYGDGWRSFLSNEEAVKRGLLKMEPAAVA